VLGLEMGYRRRLLGYEGEGSYWAHRKETKSGKRKPWADYCKDEAGITETMVRHYLECADAVRTRLTIMEATLGKGAARVLKLMEKQPSILTRKQREKLLDGLWKFGLFEADTQERLKEEFRAHRTDKPLNLPSPAVMKDQIDELRGGREMMLWLKSSEPRALEFRRKLAQLRLRQRREEQNRSIASILGISAETMESIMSITNARRILEAAHEEGGESYSAEQLYELAKRKGIME